jgi:hypothetical protein
VFQSIFGNRGQEEKSKEKSDIKHKVNLFGRWNSEKHPSRTMQKITLLRAFLLLASQLHAIFNV